MIRPLLKPGPFSFQTKFDYILLILCQNPPSWTWSKTIVNASTKLISIATLPHVIILCSRETAAVVMMTTSSLSVVVTSSILVMVPVVILALWIVPLETKTFALGAHLNNTLHVTTIGSDEAPHDPKLLVILYLYLVAACKAPSTARFSNCRIHTGGSLQPEPTVETAATALFLSLPHFVIEILVTLRGYL